VRGTILIADAVDQRRPWLRLLRTDGLGNLQPVENRVIIHVRVTEGAGPGVGEAGPAGHEQHGEAVVGSQIVRPHPGWIPDLGGHRLAAGPWSTLRNVRIIVAQKKQPIRSGRQSLQ
jgi:hypothetical protein